MSDELSLLGFGSMDELSRMVAALDLSSAAKMETFERWKDEDGTKDGLAKLPTACAQQVLPKTP